MAIIIDNFDYLVKDKSVLGAHQLSTFVKLWSIYDPSARSVQLPYSHCLLPVDVHTTAVVLHFGQMKVQNIEN